MSTNPASTNRPISYAALPVARSQPDYLETVARLRGMQPASSARARVLELGCGVGHNLLPLADRYPEARFVGIDPLPASIETGRQVAREAGLTNVEFRRQDLLELDSSLGEFDYIIASAVYSRVDAAARDKLLEVCRDHLAAQGMATVSYKTYPGSAVRNMLRHMMVYDARGAANETEEVGRARMFLEFLETSLHANESYGELLHGELSILKTQSDDYLLHDHLQEVSHPVYFPEFAQHARNFSLQPAGDGVLGIRCRDDLGETLERQLDSITDDDDERELYRDVVYNRTIRQTLLCHQSLPLPNNVAPEMLAGLYLQGALQPWVAAVDVGSTAVQQFVNRGGTRISTKVPLVKAALLHLSEAWPDYVRFEECVAAACARLEASGTPIPPEEIKRLEANLTQSCTGGVLELHSSGPSYVPRVSGKPAASRLVRWLARHGEVVANLRHEAVRLNLFERRLVDLLDGTRDRSAIIELLATAVSQGQLTVAGQQQLMQTPGDAKRAMEIAVPETLTRLARAALLAA